MRERIEDIHKQSLVTGDNVTIYISASVQYKIIDSKKALLNITNLRSAILDKCQMQLRNILSAMNVNDILHKRGEISQKVISDLGQIENDCIEIISIQIKDIEFDETMKKAMATKAEADR